MNKKNFIDDLTRRLCEALPPGLQLLKHDVEKKIHAVLQNTFNQLDLVTREEFDAQTKVLARSRKKIEELEKKLANLEKSFLEK